jgi:hypothetical protein
VLAAGGRTDDPYMTALITTQHIHNLTGMSIEPWNIGEFPADWMDAVKAYCIDYPSKAARIAKVQGKR